MGKLTLQGWRLFLKFRRGKVTPRDLELTEMYEAEIVRLSDLLAEEILATEYLDALEREES